MEFLIPSAIAQSQAAPSPEGNPMITLLMFGGLFVFMYFFIIRPQRKRQKEHKDLVSELAKGNEIVMASGLLGKVVNLDDDYVTIDAGGAELKFQKSSVHAVLPKGTIKNI